MKLLPWILSALIMALLLPVHPAELTDADLEKISSEDIAKTLRHLQSIAKEAEGRAVEAETHEAKTLGALQDMTRNSASLQSALLTVEKSAREVEKDRDKQKQLAIDEGKRADTAEKGEAIQRGLAWKWRLFCFGTWAAVIALFVFKSYLKTIPGVGLLFK